MLDYKELLDRLRSTLKKNGLKYTKQRELILETLFENRNHYTPEDLYILIKQKHPNLNIGIATIYRTLSFLEESKIVSSISFGADGKKYELLSSEHHDHLVCIKCGEIIEFQDEIIENQQELVAKKFNFKMTDHTMKIVGICQKCQNK